MNCQEINTVAPDSQKAVSRTAEHILEFAEGMMNSRTRTFDVTIANLDGKIRGKCCIDVNAQAFKILGMELPFTRIVDIVVFPAPVTLFPPDRETLTKITFVTKPE